MKTKWLYERDDGTVIHLNGDPNEMTWQLSEQLVAGWTRGKLFSEEDPRVMWCDFENPASYLHNVREFLFDVEAE